MILELYLPFVDGKDIVENMILEKLDLISALALCPGLQILELPGTLVLTHKTMCSQRHKFRVTPMRTFRCYNVCWGVVPILHQSTYFLNLCVQGLTLGGDWS